MQNYPRNPLVIFVFSVIGMTIRYVLFYVLSIIRGTKAKGIRYYSEGFKQIVYNLLLTLFIFTASVVIAIYCTFS